MIDQPLGQAGRQHELAVGDGDEAVAECMEPEFRPARLADACIEVLDGFEMAGRTGLGRKHPRLRLSRISFPLREPALQDGGKLSGDRELQRLAALGVLDADGHERHVDLRPGKRDHLREPHSGVESEAEGVSCDRVAHRRLEAAVPAWQDFRRRLDAAAARTVQPPTGGVPELHRIAQFLEVEARSAVNRAQELHRRVGLHPAWPFGQFVEPPLDVASVDVVEGPVEPVAEITVNGTAVVGDRAFPSPGSDGQVVLEGLAKGGDGSCAGTVGERILAQGNAAEDLSGAAACLVGGDVPVASDDDAPVRRFPAAVAGAVVDEIRAQSGRLNADAESGDSVVPCGVGPRLRLERLDGARGERHPDAREALPRLRC